MASNTPQSPVQFPGLPQFAWAYWISRDGRKLTVKAHGAGDCPNAEDFRRYLCLFKTGSQTLEKVDRQIDAIRKTLRHYA